MSMSDKSHPATHSHLQTFVPTRQESKAQRCKMSNWKMFPIRSLVIGNSNKNIDIITLAITLSAKTIIRITVAFYDDDDEEQQQCCNDLQSLMIWICTRGPALTPVHRHFCHRHIYHLLPRSWWWWMIILAGDDWYHPPLKIMMTILLLLQSLEATPRWSLNKLPLSDSHSL